MLDGFRGRLPLVPRMSVFVVKNLNTVSETGKHPFGAKKNYVPCILKYVRHNSNYVGHIFGLPETRSAKGFCRLREKRQKKHVFKTLLTQRAGTAGHAAK